MDHVPTPTLAAPIRNRRAGRHPILTALLIGALVLAAAIVAYHSYATWSYRASWSASSIVQRTQAAQRAALLEPYNAEFVTRGIWLQGDSELASGDYNSAVDTLRRAYRRDLENDELLASFKRAQQVQSLETVKKAHLQHGHEGPGGTLRPEDIER